MENTSFSLKAVFAKAFEAFTINFWRMLGLLILTFLMILPLYLGMIVGLFAPILEEGGITFPISSKSLLLFGILCFIGLLFVAVPFMLSWYRMFLKAVRKETLRIKDLWFGFSFKKQAWYLFGGMMRKMFPWFSILPALVLFIIAAILYGTSAESIETDLIASIQKITALVLLIIAGTLIVIETYWRMAKYNLMGYLKVEHMETPVLELAETSTQKMMGYKWRFIGMIAILFGTSLLIELPFAFIAEDSPLILLYILITIPFSIFTALCSPSFYEVLTQKKETTPEASE